MAERTEQGSLSRRDFVKAGATAAAVAGMPSAVRAAGPGDDKDKKRKKKGKKKLVPKRVLGRTGVKVSMLNLGTAQNISERMLNAAYDAGIRYIDTADCYKNGRSETIVAAWMAKKENRKKLFLVTKDHPNTPDEWVEMLDRRLEVLQTDTVDLYFVHMLCSTGAGEDASQANWPKQKRWARAAEKIKKSGKAKFVGFSTHASMPLRIPSLINAATGGWVDAIMLAYDPELVRDSKRFNKALDKCHEAGIGLISMKEMRAARNAPKFLPEFEKLGLTAHQAVLHAVWTDERIASICSDISNLKILKENSDAAKNFKPLGAKPMGAVIDLYKQYASAYCNGCDGSCSRAAGTAAPLGDIVRFLSYHEIDGCRVEARRLYAALTPEQRDWRGADLAAATRACHSSLDFASLLPRAEAKLA